MDFTRIKGRIKAVSPMKTKAGENYYKIEVLVEGNQYPIKGSTFDNALAYTGQDEIEMSYTEKDSGTPNPHKPGQNFINKTFYLPNHIKSTKPYNPSQQSPRPMQQPQANAGADSSKYAELAKRIVDLETRVAKLEKGAVQSVLPPDHEEEPKHDENIPF